MLSAGASLLPQTGVVLAVLQPRFSFGSLFHTQNLCPDFPKLPKVRVSPSIGVTDQELSALHGQFPIFSSTVRTEVLLFREENSRKMLFHCSAPAPTRQCSCLEALPLLVLPWSFSHTQQWSLWARSAKNPTALGGFSQQGLFLWYWQS